MPKNRKAVSSERLKRNLLPYGKKTMMNLNLPAALQLHRRQQSQGLRRLKEFYRLMPLIQGHFLAAGKLLIVALAERGRQLERRLQAARPRNVTVQLHLVVQASANAVRKGNRASSA